MKVKAFNIQYDTDGNKKIASKLPKEIIFENLDNDFNPEYELADEISNQTGFCVFNFNFEIIEI